MIREWTCIDGPQGHIKFRQLFGDIEGRSCQDLRDSITTAVEMATIATSHEEMQQPCKKGLKEKGTKTRTGS